MKNCDITLISFIQQKACSCILMTGSPMQLDLSPVISISFGDCIKIVFLQLW